jgi:LPXTG-site transpeptidase (sortase) family protein
MSGGRPTRGTGRLAWLVPGLVIFQVRCCLLGVMLLTIVACAHTPLTSTATQPSPTSNVASPIATQVDETPKAPPHTPSTTETPIVINTAVTKSVTLPTATPEPGLPDRLLIPKLNLDEAIVAVPIVDGEWDISDLGSQVGWLTTTGQQPGEAWAMAFVGHVSLENGTSGPFGYLWKLRVGAEIILQRDPIQYVYTVTEKRDVDADAVKDLYVADGNQIVLMTCDNWDFVNWRYTERLLVLAKLVEERPRPN